MIYRAVKINNDLTKNNIDDNTQHYKLYICCKSNKFHKVYNETNLCMYEHVEF